jgi:hypothetical protein
MQRFPDWRLRLHAVIESNRRTPFVWGQSDCAIFAADAIQAMTGQDIASGYRGTYTDAKSATKALRKARYSDLAAMAAAHLEEVAPIMAQAGDIVAMQSPETGWTLGVVIGERVIGRDLGGLVTVDRSAGERAFRVG